MKTANLIILLLLIVVEASFGQNRRRTSLEPVQVFEAGVIFGRSFAQIDGDYFTGFDKGGWYAGLRGVANLSVQSSINVEMLFSQKGSRIPHGTSLMPKSVNDRLIALDYAEVPIVFKRKFHPTPSTPFFEIGASYARLINTKIEELPTTLINGGTIYEEIVPMFSSFDVALVGGFGYSANNTVEFAMRFHTSLNKFYNNIGFEKPAIGSPRQKEVVFLRNYHLTLMIAYKLL